MKKRLFFTGFIVAITFVLLVVLLVACSQKEKEQVGSQTTSATIQQADSTPTATPAPAPESQIVTEPTATPESIPTPEPIEVPSELYATAYTRDNYEDFSFYQIDDEYYRNVQELRLYIEDTDYLSNVYVYVPDVFGLNGVQVDKTADKASVVGVSVVDMNGNTVSGESMKDVMEKGGAIILDRLDYEQIYQIRLITDVGTFACNIKIV